MNFVTENDITPKGIRELRERSGLTQTQFWRSLGCSQPAGSKYEAGAAMPSQTRTLLFVRYVVGLHLDASTKAGADELRRLARLQNADLNINEALRRLQKAASALQSQQ